MLRRLVTLLLAPFLASCQPPDIVVRAGFIGNSLAFVPLDSGDSDSLWCWSEAAVLDDRLRPAWQFTGSGTGDCRTLFPLQYGRAPDGADTKVEPARLEPGRLYVLIGNATADVYGAFSLSRAGDLWLVHNVDPGSPAADAVRQRWWNRASGTADSPPPAAKAER